MPHKFHKIISLHPLLFFCTVAIAQYKGGSNDGFNNSTYNRQNTSDINAFKGGANDGVSYFLFNKQNITDDAAFKGGSNDGYSVTTFIKQNIGDAAAFKGGGNDGYTVTTFSKQNITDNNAFKGSSNDGYAVTNFTRQSITDTAIFKGGSNDGFSFSIYLKNSNLVCTPPISYNVIGGGAYCVTGMGVAIGLSNSEVGVNYQLLDALNNNIGPAVAGTGSVISLGQITTGGTYTVVAASIYGVNCTTNMNGNAIVTINNDPNTVTWTGTVNTDWHNPGNWSCGAVPAITTNVIINTAVNNNYPEIKTANAFCHSLLCKPGITIIVKTGYSLTIQ